MYNPRFMLHEPQVGHFAPQRVASVGFHTWVIKIDFHSQLRRLRFNRLIYLRLAVGVKAAKDILLFNMSQPTGGFSGRVGDRDALIA